VRKRRIELVSSRGKLLRQFAFSECDVAGPPTASGHANEMRGVARAQLLQALAGQLPPSALHLGAGVTGVTSGGGAGGALGVAGAAHACARVCVCVWRWG
jgi:hypothetical protein